MQNHLNALYTWYLAHARDLPWRRQTDPYAVWISEVILQQTRVNQGLAYYYAFLERFPTVEALAAADEQAVLKAWEGLGYYSRARNLQAAARQLMAAYGGVFPRSWAQLVTLKGVGPYTARAIAAFAFGERTAVLDGNVFRVLARLWADDTPIDSARARAHFQPLADELVAHAPDPALHNNAVMELGATLCTVHNPACLYCPLAAACRAHALRNPAAYPVKGKRRESKERHFAFYLWQTPQGVAWVQRSAGFWKGLYVLPHLELPEPPAEPPLLQEQHVFTHFRMHLHVYKGVPAQVPPDLYWIKPGEWDNYPLPKAMHKVLGGLQARNLLV
ncbi:MAG: A/G-specific adenine glycosylase [Bacteroidetes bacterium]|nr:A/G-specific adenine glycosylase [Bacteroidota bacterium]